MATIQPNTHSFIIKVWRVDSDAAHEGGAWHGRITHVPSGEIHYFVQLHEIADYLIPYLQPPGEQPPRWWQLCHWRIRRWLGW